MTADDALLTWFLEVSFDFLVLDLALLYHKVVHLNI